MPPDVAAERGGSVPNGRRRVVRYGVSAQRQNRVVAVVEIREYPSAVRQRQRVRPDADSVSVEVVRRHDVAVQDAADAVGVVVSRRLPRIRADFEREPGPSRLVRSLAERQLQDDSLAFVVSAVDAGVGYDFDVGDARRRVNFMRRIVRYHRARSYRQRGVRPARIAYRPAVQRERAVENAHAVRVPVARRDGVAERDVVVVRIRRAVRRMSGRGADVHGEARASGYGRGLGEYRLDDYRFARVVAGGVGGGAGEFERFDRHWRGGGAVHGVRRCVGDCVDAERERGGNGRERIRDCRAVQRQRVRAEAYAVGIRIG